MKKMFYVLYKGIPLLMGMIYISLCGWLVYMRDERIIRVIIVPAVTFAGVSIFRKVYDAPRPYEVCGVKPLIPKDKKGQSFPSRHTVSAFAIAMACLYVNVWLGVVTLFLAVVVAATRVIARVHFVRDVVAGTAISVIVGIIGFW